MIIGRRTDYVASITSPVLGVDVVTNHRKLGSKQNLDVVFWVLRWRGYNCWVWGAKTPAAYAVAALLVLGPPLARLGARVLQPRICSSTNLPVCGESPACCPAGRCSHCAISRGSGHPDGWPLRSFCHLACFLKTLPVCERPLFTSGRQPRMGIALAVIQRMLGCNTNQLATKSFIDGAHSQRIRIVLGHCARWHSSFRLGPVNLVRNCCCDSCFRVCCLSGRVGSTATSTTG